MLWFQAQYRLANTKFVSEITELSNRLSEASRTFKELDTKINVVSGKIIHLGDQLERRNAPRESLKEARRLILEFSKFLGAGGGTFTNPSVNSRADEMQVCVLLFFPYNYDHIYFFGSLCLAYRKNCKYSSTECSVFRAAR